MSSRMHAMERESIRVTRSVSLPVSEIEIRVSRSSGPGGQHAQKSSTRVEAVLEVEASQALTEAQKRRGGPPPGRGGPGGAPRDARPPPHTAAPARGAQARPETQKGRVIARAGPVLRAVAQDERSQLRNRELAVERLVAKLRAALAVPRRRRPTTPSAASRERRLEDKRRRARRKALRRPPDED